MSPGTPRENGSSHGGRRLSRMGSRRSNVTTNMDPAAPLDDRGDPAVDGGNGHGSRRVSSRRSAGYLAATETHLPDGGETGNEAFNLGRSNSGRQMRASARSSRRNPMKQESLGKRLGTPLAAARKTIYLQPSSGTDLPTVPLMKSHPPVLAATGPSDNNNTERRRPFDPCLDGLLKKVRDPSVRNLGALVNDDDPEEGEDVPTIKQHKNLSEEKLK
jgi:hypothetical protein